MVTVAALAMLALVGCSSGSSSGKAKAKAIGTKWDAAGTTRVRALAARIQSAVPGQCADFALYPRVAYVTVGNRIGRKVPSAVGNCQAFANDVEITSFTSAGARAAFVDGLTAKLCKTASKLARTKSPFPGLYWVEGGTWAAQPDGEPAGRRIASILGGRYRLAACPGVTGVGWDPQGVAHVQQLAAKLAAARVGCTDLQLADHESLKTLDQYQPHAGGLPLALGQCTVGGAAGGTEIVAFKDAAARDQLLPVESAGRCKAGESGVVVGDDFAVFLPGPALGPQVAAATGGTFRAAPCL